MSAPVPSINRAPFVRLEPRSDLDLLDDLKAGVPLREEETRKLRSSKVVSSEREFVPHSRFAIGVRASLTIHPNGRVLSDRPQLSKGPRNLSTVTRRIFFGPDLNKIAATIRANQQANITDPATPSQQLFVDDDGNIVFGDQVDGSPGRQLSKVTQETFYSNDRYAQELAIVRQKLPKNSQYATDDEVGGWL